MEALMSGTIESHDAKKLKRKRGVSVRKRLDMIGEGADVVIANDRKVAKAKERPWQRALRKGEFASALDMVLDATAPDHAPLNVLTLLVALRHRSAMREALEGRDESSVQPILRWTCNHISDPRYLGVCVEISMHLLDLYSEFTADSGELRDGFKTLKRRVVLESERAQLASMAGGQLESLLLGAA
jgi:U3 small nucleolar RNA-associated protein 15